MFSLDRFYNILHSNFIQPLNGESLFFWPFGTYQNFVTLRRHTFERNTYQIPRHFPLFLSGEPKANSIGVLLKCYFFDQEPLHALDLTIQRVRHTMNEHPTLPKQMHVFANSEISEQKTQYCRDYKMYDWYYFYHGFAALDWYRDFEYANPSVFENFKKVFICYNHLTSKLRSYRLHLVSNLIEQDLVKHGLVSFFLKDEYGTWQETVADPDNPLDNRARQTISRVLVNQNTPLIIDTAEPTGSMSAKVDLDQLTQALFHVVTETIYFDPKLHLTEKVFKPIVAKRPFFLVAATANLAYLKRYGFRTFDRWIDESYDNETDHYIRIEKITAELKRLCSLPDTELRQMHAEMKETLEYNFQHFYGEFKKIIVREMAENFSSVLRQINHGRIPGNHSLHHHRFELDIDPIIDLLSR